MQFICKIAMLILAMLNLFTPFIQIDLSVITFSAAIAVLLSSIVLTSKGFKKITMIFLLLGISLLLYSRQPFFMWITATNSMTNVISILVIMQLFSIPIEAGKYDIAVRYWLTNLLRGEPALFLFSTVVTHIFSSFLLFGTIPVMVSLLGDTLKRNVSHYERFLAAATSRGYALAVLWAPGAINLLLVIQATGVRWIDVLIPGLLLSLLGIITSYVLEAKLNLSSKVQQAGEDQGAVSENKTLIKRKNYHIIAVVVSLVLITIILEKLNFGSSSNRIMLAGATVALVWTAILVGQPSLKKAVAHYWENSLLKSVDLASLFIAMGVFSTALQKSGLLILIQPNLQIVANTLGLSAMVVLPVLMIVCAIAGIHPFISIVMFGQILTSLHLPISPLSLALCLALGGSVSYIVSPFAGIVLTLAKFINSRTIDIAFHWNGVYSLLFLAEGIIFAYFWGRFFG